MRRKGLLRGGGIGFFADGHRLYMRPASRKAKRTPPMTCGAAEGDSLGDSHPRKLANQPDDHAQMG